MSEELVIYERKPPAVVLHINRPDKRNALSRGLIAVLRERFERARDDASVRCVILTGVGSVFCAGMDLAELAASVQNKSASEGVWDDALKLATLYDLIYTLPKPTIAAANGSAVAGGAGLVTVCDLAVSVPEAKFGYPEVRRGLVAAMVMPYLMRHVGERMARYLLLTGELISAEQACQSGLINAVESADQRLECALDWAKSLAEGGPKAIAQTKTLLRAFSHRTMSIEEAAKASAAPRLTEECRQGLQAFFDKRPAPWSSNA